MPNQEIPMKKLLLVLTLTLSAALISGCWITPGVGGSNCVSNKTAIQYREYQNRCDEKLIQNTIANGGDGDAMRAALQPVISQRNALIASYKTKDENIAAVPCVVVPGNTDLVNGCK